MTFETLVEHLMEIKEKQAETYAKVESLDEKLDRHTESSSEAKKEIESLKRDVNKAKGAIAFIGLLAVVMGIAKFIL
jgi:peptidoglycan hydrolase CwlO-like protein